MKLIKLTQGRFACVDDEDFEWLSQWSWHYKRNKNGNTGYAIRNIGFGLKRRQFFMHVATMKRYKRLKHGKEVDHKNTCGCDNRKINLRLATRKAQRANSRPQSNNTSGIAGVSWRKDCDKWRAYITVNDKQKHLGYHFNKKDAIAERRKAEIKHFGEYHYDPKLLCPLWKTGQCLDCTKRAQELGLIT